MTVKDIILIISVSGVTTLNVFLSGALAVALPTIGRDLGFKQADLQWPINAYNLAYGCLLLFFGRMGDILGAKTMFIAGSAWFSLWSLLTSFAPSPPLFILFVALSALGAAANTPSAIGIFTSTFPPGSSLRNRAFGVMGAGQPIGFILGLVLGGALTGTKATGWRAIFYVQCVLGFLFAALGLVVLRRTEGEGVNGQGARYGKGLDWIGALLSTTGMAFMTYSLADAATAVRGWKTPQIPSLLSASALLLALFVWYERRREQEGLSVLLPPSMFNQPGAKMSTVLALVFFAWWSFNSVTYFATLFYQQVELLTPIQTTPRFVPMAISGFTVNLVTGWLMDRFSGQYIILLGLVGSVAAPIIFALIDVNASYWAMMFPVMVLVVGADAVYPVGNLQVCSAFDADSQSLAGGVFAVATRLGTSLGLAITSSISTSISARYAKAHPELPANDPAVLMAGFRAAGWVCTAAAGIAFVIGAVGLRGVGIVGRRKVSDAAITYDDTAPEATAVRGKSSTVDHKQSAGINFTNNDSTDPQAPVASTSTTV